MRLLACSSTGKLSLTEDLIGDDEIPPYAILSHTWQHGQEVIFDDLMNGTGESKAGYQKIQFCAEQARRDDLHHIWVDTCCINKKEHVELQDAINSMFRWYQGSAQCYVYLWDVSASSALPEANWEPSFRASRWFTRGWTLQELLAPRDVKFFSREGKLLGDRTTLEQQIHEITGIAISALRAMPLTSFSIEERLSWIKGRKTTRKEDKVYSLLGLFGIYLLPNYGEGEEYAFKRFYREIDESLKDPPRHQDLIMGTTENDTACHLPLPRPRSFVGRKSVLARIRTHILAEEGSRLAIYGLGGCGKTALALESAYWTKEQRPIRAIFWVPAMSRESFEQAYYEIATCLRLPGIDDPQVDFQQLVKTKLSDEEFGAWLIVVDNADNTGVLFDGVEGSRLIDYLPRSQRGSIIFTTRTRAAATELARDNVIALGELQRAEAVEMLDRRLLHEHRHHLRESGTVDRFLEMLYFHALAIVQAVAFINTNDVTISDYIELYGHSEGDAMDLLNEEFDDQGRYMEATNSVATTWYISFEHVQKRDAIAADHLFFMACVANNDVVATMFPPLYSKTEHVKAMGTLKAYAFVTERQPRTDKLQGQTKSQHKTFDVHPLVHLAIRGWLKAHCQWTLWIETTLARLITIVPYGDHDTQDHWKAYMNHSMHVIGLPEVQELEGRMTLLERIGRCEWSLGRYRAAERAYRQAYEQRLAMSGREHPDTLITMGNIALMLGCLDKWEEAENMHREELTLTKKVLGDQHPHTLTSQGNLALAVLGQWRYMEAGQMYGEMLPLQKEVLGEKHPDTMTTMQNLGAALRGLGDHAGAEQMHREALALRREVQGDEHADTLSTLCALGTALRAQCKYAEAEEIHREELALRKRVLGEEHPDTVTSMRKLGNILCSREKHIEAEEMQKTALEISEKVSGKDNPATLACRSAVAHILHSQGKYAESEEIHRGTLAAKEKVLGKEHRDTLMSVYWLAELSHDQMRYQDALGLYERAYNGFLRTFGPDHPTAKECLVHLTWVKRAVEEDRAAETAKAARAQEEAVKDVHVTATTSASTLSEQRTSSQVSSRPRGKWRARLHQIVKKSG